MADLAELYAAGREDIAGFVTGLSEDDLARPVPATPSWSVHDVVAHLAAGAACTAAGDFPQDFFFDVGTPESVAVVNEWTGRHLTDRRRRPLGELLDEWRRASEAIAPMMRGDEPWPDGVVFFAARVLVTDLTVHQQDLYGALGIVRDRDVDRVRIGFATYTAGVDLRIKAAGGPALRFVTEHKEVVAGDGEPAATVRAPRFELFRALSGRRSVDQVRAYEWEGDPEPFLELFYPYGIRDEALVE